jgi:hypothetical protein
MTTARLRAGGKPDTRKRARPAVRQSAAGRLVESLPGKDLYGDRFMGHGQAAGGHALGQPRVPVIDAVAKNGRSNEAAHSMLGPDHVRPGQFSQGPADGKPVDTVGSREVVFGREPGPGWIFAETDPLPDVPGNLPVQGHPWPLADSPRLRLSFARPSWPHDPLSASCRCLHILAAASCTSAGVAHAREPRHQVARGRRLCRIAGWPDSPGETLDINQHAGSRGRSP